MAGLELEAEELPELVLEQALEQDPVLVQPQVGYQVWHSIADEAPKAWVPHQRAAQLSGQ